MRAKSYVPVTVAMLSAAGLSIFAATVAVDRIEAGARLGIARAVQEEGHDWARVEVDGLRVEMTGVAPDEASRFAALTAAGTVVDATRIIDRMEVRPSRQIVAPEFTIEILRNLDGVSLIGLIPTDADRIGILERVGEISGSQVTDLLEEGTYPVPEGWQAAVDFALDALARMPRSKVSVNARQVNVTGMVDSEQVRRRVENDLGRSVPAGVRLTLDISAPRPVIAPFTVRFVIEDGKGRFDACAAETPEMRETILRAARNAGLQGPDACQIGLGAPSLEWAEAVSEGVATLARLGEGSVTFSDADVSLVAPHTVDSVRFDREMGALERALPKGFSLTAVRTPPPEAELSADEVDPEAPVFQAELDPETGVSLSGRISTELARETIESYAHAHFGLERTTSTTRVSKALPQGWTLRVLAGLDALARLGEGSVLVTADALTVTGKTGSKDASAEIARMLSSRLGAGAKYDIDITYEEQLDPELGIPTAEECVGSLNAILAQRKITFEPGSATVDGDGLKIIDRLADVLRDCHFVKMEIAGHTDSQGRESMNLRLSQERADAVLNALMARRILTSNLSAKGYGETIPIADNSTEGGREDNRRIEFTLIEEAPDTAEDAANVEAGAEEAASEQN